MIKIYTIKKKQFEDENQTTKGTKLAVKIM